MNKILLENYMDNIVPDGCVLFKDSGMWNFYLSDSQFERGYEPTFSQTWNENIHQFIERVVKALIEHEDRTGDKDPIVTIDYAIYSDPKYNQQ